MSLVAQELKSLVLITLFQLSFFCSKDHIHLQAEACRPDFKTLQTDLPGFRYLITDFLTRLGLDMTLIGREAGVLSAAVAHLHDQLYVLSLHGSL